MRLLFSSAALSTSFLPAAALPLPSQGAQVQNARDGFNGNRLATESEREPFESRSTNAFNHADVGVLPPKQHRFLQDSETPFVCPATCPEPLCSCAETTDQGYPDAQDCATELNSVCTNDETSLCFNNTYLPFYDEVYCKTATCFLDDNYIYEDCTCEYYEGFCKLYEDYATDAYPDIVDKCATADCCKKAKNSGDKILCLPAMLSRPSSAPSEVAGTPDPPAVPAQAPTTADPSASPTNRIISTQSPVTLDPSANPTMSPPLMKPGKPSSTPSAVSTPSQTIQSSVPSQVTAPVEPAPDPAATPVEPAAPTQPTPAELYENEYWADLPPEIQAAYGVLLYNETAWNTGIKSATYVMDWDELTPEMQDAALLIGYNEEVWCEPLQPSALDPSIVPTQSPVTSDPLVNPTMSPALMKSGKPSPIALDSTVILVKSPSSNPTETSSSPSKGPITVAPSQKTIEQSLNPSPTSSPTTPKVQVSEEVPMLKPTESPTIPSNESTQQAVRNPTSPSNESTQQTISTSFLVAMLLAGVYSLVA